MNRLAIVVAALALAGCSSSAAATATTSPPVTVTATTTATVTVSMTPTFAPATAKLLPLGTAYEQKTVKLTVSEVKGFPKGQHDQPMFGAMTQACNVTASPVTFSSYRWTVAAADGSTFQVTNIVYRSDPTPLYPSEQVVDSGQCIKGWLLYEVPSGMTIDQIRYAVVADSGPMLATWKV